MSPLALLPGAGMQIRFTLIAGGVSSTLAGGLL